MSDKYQSEEKFFDAIASKTDVQAMSRKTFERYAHPARPHLFAKEKMFSLLDSSTSLKVLEIGCGEGVASMQLAYCGHAVTGIDISSKSIDVAKLRAKTENLPAEFRVANVVTEDVFGDSLYDVVWCDSVLHHLTDELDTVMNRLHRSLRKGGLFIAREPVAYAAWLKSILCRLPGRSEATPDEQPLRDEEMAVIRKYFPDFEQKYYRVMARINNVTSNLDVIAFFAKIDNVILSVNRFTRLAGTTVIWGRKQ